MILPPLLLALSLSAPSRAQGAAWDARVTAVEGEAVVIHAGSQEPVEAEPDMPLEQGDRILTGGDGRIELALEANSVMEVGPGSEFVVESLRHEGSGFLLSLGRLAATLRSLGEGRALRVRTPVAVAAVRGTEFGLHVEEDGDTAVGVHEEGRVAVSPAEGAGEAFHETSLEPGEEAHVGRERVETEEREGRRLLRKRKLTRVEFVKGRIEHLRARRSTLRERWKSMPPEQRRRLRERARQKLRQAPPKLRRELRQRQRENQKRRDPKRRGPRP